MKCSYCGAISHAGDDCARRLISTGRRAEQERKALDRLLVLATDAMRYEMKMHEMPEAVRLLAVLNRTFVNDREE